jgi:hypothetical protein
MKQIPYSEPANIRRHRVKFSRSGDLAQKICAPLAGPEKGAGQLPRAPICKRRLDVTRITRNVVLVHSGFHTHKNLSENYPQFGHAPSEGFDGPVLDRKSSKNIGFKGRQIISMPGTPTCLGPLPLAMSVKNQNTCNTSQNVIIVVL